jgi:hypothetical protein
VVISREDYNSLHSNLIYFQLKDNFYDSLKVFKDTGTNATSGIVCQKHEIMMLHKESLAVSVWKSSTA